MHVIARSFRPRGEKETTSGATSRSMVSSIALRFRDLAHVAADRRSSRCRIEPAALDSEHLATSSDSATVPDTIFSCHNISARWSPPCTNATRRSTV